MKSTLKYSLLALSTALTLQTAQGVVVFSDNFDGETLGTNLTPSQWTLVQGRVDVIGDPNFYDFLPGNGRYIDMDGSSNAGGWISHEILLTAGDYVLSYDYAGNQRADQQESIGAGVFGVNSPFFLDQFHSPGYMDDFTTASLSFSLPVDQLMTLNFATFDSSDNIGPLLDNVKLERIDRPNGVPEGGAGVALLGLALGSLVGARRFVRRQS
jgi:hypothetical protein